MNYELAKQLKDAGFPEHDSDYCNVGGCWLKENVHLPTLSELIEACGRDAYLAVHKQGKCYAHDALHSEAITVKAKLLKKP